jgi:hypothetical protein
LLQIGGLQNPADDLRVPLECQHRPCLEEDTSRDDPMLHQGENGADQLDAILLDPVLKWPVSEGVAFT